MTFVLRSSGADYYGKPMWFKQMTAIGPMTTINPDERMEFATRDDAMACPCWRHTLSTWEIEEIPSEGAKA